MGGDHKCPVCQATFTRPQHVARHMRSHTGDRPYKCQHCGDQFARSDLLSRHVNKCHANEKPPQAAGNTRRKGSASASRAITSKQACDQCVQSSLPCDGCNPCAKCVQRKCRCTFVKFHRQTAPAGPGHNPRPSSASARVPGYPASDDFLLAAPPPLSVGTTMTLPENLYAQQFSFQQIYTDAQDFSIPRAASDTSDYAQRFRAQADLLRRASLDNFGNVGQTLYNEPPWLGWHQQNSSEPNFSQNNVHNSLLETRCLPDDTRPFTMDKDIQESLSRHVMDQRDQQYPSQSLRSPQFSLGGADALQKGRRGSLDFSSDSSSGTSSSVHLPLDVPSVHMTYHVGLGEQHQETRQLIYNLGQDVSGHNQYPLVMNQPSQHSQLGEGGFSSAFGLMSLDDPNVLAGLSHDGVPYFSTNMNMYPGDPNATPMPTKQGATSQRTDNYGSSTSSLRETETRELREFWKTYMRTPLSGPGPALDANAHAGTHQRRPSTPSSVHRRVRVNSLPSAKTPTAEGVKPHYPNGTNNASGANGTSSIRTTLHGNVDDLRSYEAAVLARKTPTLHLAPRKRGNVCASPQIGGGHVSGNVSQGGVKTDVNRPSSASSASSLADAFGKSGELCGALRENMGTRRSPPSRESSLSLTGEESASDVDVLRPSFKRLPSQTLGPEKSKRALLSRQGGEGEDVKGGRHDGNSTGGTGKGFSELHQQCHAVPLTDRHRRLGPPGAALTAPVFFNGQGLVES